LKVTQYGAYFSKIELAVFMKVEIISPSNPNWGLTIGKLAHDFYHLPNYAILESNRLNAMPQGIVIQDGAKCFFLPYLLRSCEDMQKLADREIYDVTSSYGYPSFVLNEAGKDLEFISGCFKALKNTWYEQNICSAFIRLHPIINSHIPQLFPPEWNFIHTHSDTVVCDLQLTEEQLWQQTRKSHRTKINKLNRLGFRPKITLVDNINSLESFIQVYEETMSRVGAKNSYLFGREYFLNLISALDRQLYVCEIETCNQIVAASLITEVGGIVQYHLGGTKTEFLHQSPSTLMFDYIRTWAKKRDNNFLHLGGGVGNAEDSLYHFKAGFSKITKPFMTMRMIVNEVAYNKLIKSTALASNRTLLEMLESSFFPAYRS
jgi:Acetyltransferase (GNAT) domain